MIVFDLRCGQGHRFEGWFASGEAFEGQHARGLVTCPMCSDKAIERLPSARVSVPKAAAPRRMQPASSAPAHAAASTAGTAAVSTAGTAAASSARTTQDVAAGVPAEVLARLRELVRDTENVGRRFPEEARKIHYEEAPARPIRGQASAEEAEALREEGIEFDSVPPFLLPDAH